MANLYQTVGEILGDVKATQKSVDEIKDTLNSINTRLTGIEMREAKTRASIATISAVVGTVASCFVAGFSTIIEFIKS